MTQQEVALKLDCSCKVLSNYELDKRIPDFDTLTKMCDYFNVTADYLLGRTSIAKYYKEIVLDHKAEELLEYFEKLPQRYKDDVLRYARLNTLDKNQRREDNSS